MEIIKQAHRECSANGIPRVSHVLCCAELLHLLSIADQIDLPLDDEEAFWRELRTAQDNGNIPSLGMSITDLAIFCDMEGLDIIEVSERIEHIDSEHKRKNRRREIGSWYSVNKQKDMATQLSQMWWSVD